MSQIFVAFSELLNFNMADQKPQSYIKFIRWFHEFSVTMNLQIFQEIEFVNLF